MKKGNILFLNRKALYTSIIFLQIIVALILGLLIYRKVFLADILNSSQETEQTDGSDRQTTQPSANHGVKWDEKNILEMPQEGTEDEKKSHFDAAVKLAQETKVIELVNCKGMPVVAKVKPNSKVTLINKDNTELSIAMYGNDSSYKIPPNGQVSFIANFSKGIGLYGYGCSKLRGTSGFIFVHE